MKTEESIEEKIENFRYFTKTGLPVMLGTLMRSPFNVRRTDSVLIMLTGLYQH